MILKCSDCGIKFSYETEDVRHGAIIPFAYVECPVCGRKIFIN